MPDTNEYIARLMNRNDDDLDEILSFADNIRTNVFIKKEKTEADDIIDGIFSDNSIIAKNPVRSEICSSVKQVENRDDSAFSTHILPVVHNYHHVLPTPEQFRFTPFREEKHESKYNVISDPVIYESFHENTKDADFSQKNNKKDSEQKAEKDSAAKKKNRHKHSIWDEVDDTNCENAEEFIRTQSIKHPKFYLIVGISIFFLTLFGIGSFIYFGLNAMRKFCETYT